MKNNRLHPLNYCPWSGATGYFLQKFVTIWGEALGPAILLRGPNTGKILERRHH